MGLNPLGSVGTVLKFFGPKLLKDTFEPRRRNQDWARVRHPVEALFDPQSSCLWPGLLSQACTQQGAQSWDEWLGQQLAFWLGH